MSEAFGVVSTFPGTVPRSQALTAVLALTFFGEFSTVVAPAIYFTIHRRKGSGRTSCASLVTIATMYVMAAMYTLAALVTLFRNPTTLSKDHTFYTPTLDAIGTAALTINTVLSNAVVWSRVWALWGHNKALYGASLFLLLLTLVSGLYGVSEKSGYNFFENNTELWMGGFYWGSLGGLIACWAALATNTLAFILYLVKALRLRSNEAESVGRRVARHFVRTLESGTIFAIIWLLMVVYHMGTGDGNLTTTDGFSFFTNGALVSLLGACAALILLLDATGYSEASLVHDAADDEQILPLSREK